MVSKKKKNKIQESLSSLNKTDVYSLLLFCIYKMQDVPEYSALSELCYILDGDNLSKLLSYYGGMTIKIPTLKEMRVMTQAILLYQYVALEDGNFNDCLQVVCGDEFKEEEILNAYNKLTEVIANYEFSRN